MIFYPNLYLKNILEINYEMLKQNNIKGLILDVDNTLIDYYRKMLDGTENWCENLKKYGLKFCILSNSNKEEKVKYVANTLDIPYIFFAKKPFKLGFKKAQKLLQLENKEIAVVGDQIFTDVIGANRSKMFSILVEPIKEKDILITRIKRPIENFIIKRYMKKQKNMEENK